ncbi:MAG: NAD-dependent succinate-semialdehyde dehydrogenase [Candidatus Aenigmarchaeota archaeon]|nr:NAD-dependent succinate-semialdehyde dehydrogenase [Candidatus Aenigmarchaeota archaeon]
MPIQSINPSTGEMMAEFPLGTLENAVKVSKKLRESREWARLDIAEKAKAVRKMSSGLLKGKREYAETMTKEMGKPIKQAVAEVEKCAWMCDYFADNAEQFTMPEEVKTDYKRSYIELDPLGVILGVMPWNFPYWQVLRFAVPALLVGNRIIVKHASNVPQCALHLDNIFNAALPPLAYSNVFLSGSDAEKLIESDYIDGVSITGSTAAGARVAAAAGRSIKKSVLELGGSDPFIVLKDADVQAAATTAVKARFQNTGQSCIASKRFIVEKSVARQFLEVFIDAVEAQKVGDPLDESTDIGPLARSDLRDDLHGIVERTKAMGAEIETGGFPMKGKGCFYSPTVISRITESMPIMKEEAFGPAAPVIIAADAKEAIAIANRSEYGLAASLWTSDLDKAALLARELETGMVSVNDMSKSDPRLPFGGVKKSGYGRELSRHCVREFANAKTVVMK